MKFCPSICKYKIHILANEKNEKWKKYKWKKALWFVKLRFEGKICKKMRFDALILKDISG